MFPLRRGVGSTNGEAESRQGIHIRDGKMNENRHGATIEGEQDGDPLGLSWDAEASMAFPYNGKSCRTDRCRRLLE
jgi:hypothetical protein